MERLAERNGGRAGLAALVTILLLGLGLRAVEAWDGRPPVYDAAAYAAIAANLERGEGFELGPDGTQPAGNYSPGLPLLVGGLYELAGGAHERFARIVLALLGSLAILFAHLIGRRLSGPLAGLIAAGAVAVYPALLEYQGMLMSEPLAATLLSGAILAILRATGTDAAGGARVLSRGRGAGWSLGFSPSSRAAVRERGRGEKQDAAPPRHPSPAPPARGWLLAGLLLGALALVRPEYLGVSVLIALVVLVWERREWRRGVVSAGALLVGVVLVVAPWTVRNAVVLDRFVPVSTGGGQVLFAGSYLPSDGDPERVGAEVLERHPSLRRQLPADPRLEQILAALAERRHPGMETDRALGRMGRQRLADAVTEQPLEYAGFVAAKLWRIWGRGAREAMEAPAWKAFHRTLVALGLLGLGLLAARRRREALLLGAVLLAVTAVGALLVASPRRALVTIPLVAALAGVGATACRDSLARWLR